ncbi:MAG: D-alanyl-D-alanine carboxypeptidase family protein [Patescibacteria group bacterium]
MILGVLAAIGIALVFARRADAPTQSNIEDKPGAQSAVSSQQGFNKQQFPIDQASSLWMVVNKERTLPSEYVPADLTNVLGEQLRADAADALNKLLAGAKAQGITLKVISGYRSYNDQKNLHNGYVKADGQAKADTYSARAGHSEHQTGLAVDLGDINGNCDLQACFRNTKAGEWLAEYAHEHGFIIRYPESKEAITGYQYEPWHLRYVGIDLATELSEQNKTLEEFFNIVPSPQPY